MSILPEICKNNEFKRRVYEVLQFFGEFAIMFNSSTTHLGALFSRLFFVIPTCTLNLYAVNRTNLYNDLFVGPGATITHYFIRFLGFPFGTITASHVLPHKKIIFPTTITNSWMIELNLIGLRFPSNKHNQD